jgi:hypothetical protein
MPETNRLEAACRGDDWLESPRLQCLGFDCTVRANDETLLRYVSWLYEACATRGSASHEFIVRRRPTSSNASTTVYLDGTTVVRNVPPGLAVARVVWEINQGTVAEAGDRLLLHAAAAEREGAVAIVPGRPGAGKSTLVAALTQAGLRYVTDEAVAIDPLTTAIEPYPKPIALERDTPVLTDLRAPVPPALDSGVEQRLVPPNSIRPDALAPPGGIARLVLFTSYKPDGETAIHPLSRAEATVTLAEHAFNFRARGPGTLALLADVVRSCRCFRLDVNDLEVACRLVIDLLVKQPAERQ